MIDTSRVSFGGGVRPLKVYAYTTPEYANRPWRGGRDGYGLIKVGDTVRDADVRILEQLEGVRMPDTPEFELLLVESAITESGEAFRDHDVHEALVRAGVHRVTREGKPTEWFECTVEEVKAVVQQIKAGKPVVSLRARQSFEMREEQEWAVEVTAAYFKANENVENPPHFLWNAKMRFGKTFAAYQLAKRMGWNRVLVLTYKPAVEHSWREDLESHVDFTGWRFKGKNDPPPDLDDPSPLVWFASFQDVLGTDDSGQPKEKNKALYDVRWDVLIIDEYHFGAWRDAARDLYLSDAGDPSERRAVETPDLDEDFSVNLEESIRRANLAISNYLYLSGTPFRAITQGEFLEDQIFNWTYSDEQRAKEEAAKKGGPNPYAALPKMHLLVYEMPEKLKSVALNNVSEFSLTEFFKAEKRLDGRYYFVHENAVQKWLALLRGQDIDQLWASVSNQSRPPLPYEDTNLLRALQHTVWYLPSVAACQAMADLLRQPHNGFQDYQIIVAAGAKAGVGEKALRPVREAIGGDPQQTKTITLTCGKLLTGVTVPAWTGIFMLRELKSPESYFQAAFRVQSPWVSRFADPKAGGEKEHIHKEHCYVFDFSPNRALQLIVDYATRLRSETASQRDDEAAVAEFMEFLPVLSFDGFAMKQLQAGDVLDYLTQGISASMLARRWNSPELLKLDLRAMETILANEELLASLEQIDTFRNIRNDLTAIISSTRELGEKSVRGDKLTEDEKKRKKETAKQRLSLRDKLQHFLTRIPAFMYLTDDREKSVKDIIEQVEPELFKTVTGLTLRDFKMLVDAGVFNDSKMNDAVWKFRSFELPSLRYGTLGESLQVVGGWTETRPIDELSQSDES